MRKKPYFLISFALMSFLIVTGTAGADITCWWRLDGDFVDYSGKDHNGTPMGEPNFVDGKLNLAINLNPLAPISITNQYINCGPAFDFSTAGDGGVAHGVTVTAWVNHIDDQSHQDHKICGCLNVETWNEGAGFQLVIYQNLLEWDIRDSKGRTFTRGLLDGGRVNGEHHDFPLASTTLAANTWYHVAEVLDDDANTITEYVNGEVIRYLTDITTSLHASESEFRIGANTPTHDPGRVFRGFIDDLRIYDEPLTQDSIKAVMHGAGIEPGLAFGPIPVNKTTEVPRDVVLGWRPGAYAVKHNVYLGTDVNAVSEANETNPCGVLASLNQDKLTFEPNALLEFGKTYYWRIDEVNDLDPNSPWEGPLWSFTTANFMIVDNFESYNDVDNLVFNTWLDCVTNNTGMTVGHTEPGVSIIEKSIPRSGKQSMYMRYDNDGSINQGLGPPLEMTGTKLYSEAERELADAQDWTKDGTSSLSLWFRGMPSVGTFTPGPPIYRLTAAGRDIWDASDQFHFAYKKISGNEGSISAKVLSVTNTNVWAKAGVMIRETLDAGSKHAMMIVSPPNPSGGAAFQRRPSANRASTGFTYNLITPPLWLKISRKGNTFTASRSDDGVNWTTLDSATMTMLTDFYIGLCLTSRNVDQTCVAEFSDVKIEGTVTGDWKSQDIGVVNNIAEQLYVALQDSANESAVVKHIDPAATIISTWTEWPIPLTDFTDANPNLNLQAIKKMIIGVGEIGSTTPGGSGTLYIDDIRLYRP